ncbi:MAG TPA: methyltransferase domain-containing protein [Pyrinomonadaceae bacterium]|jgi:SAM-dependent methyltransferase/glycosyltransferase involved in cell wall biosynthesis
MKLAYFSPLGPQRSGISDYSEELLPHLAEAAEITLFVDGFQPVNRELNSRFEVCDYRRQRSYLRQLDRFDAVVYHLGNDHRYHIGIFEAMKHRSGVVVFHDFALQEFFLGMARERNDLRFYLDEVEFCHGKQAREEAAESLARGALPSILARPIEFPMNRRIAGSAEGIIVHSEWSRARFAAIASNVPVARIAMPVKLPNTSPPHSRSSDVVKIASFGLITPGKGIEHSLRALSALKHNHRFRYSLVGETNAFFDVRDLVRRYGMEDCVEITGHLSLEEFKRRIDETDIALNIRERTVGETSASLCRLMAAGVCSVVTEAGWYAELPNDSVVKIPLDSVGDELLLAYLERLIEDRPLRERIGENARRYALDEFSAEHRAADYLTFIRDVIGRRPRRDLIAGVSQELTLLGVKSSQEGFLRGVAEDIADLFPAKLSGSETVSSFRAGAGAKTEAVAPNGNQSTVSSQHTFTGGRMAKPEGIDYKRAAIEYPGRLDAERSHYLKTKPFYNLANKPDKHQGDGMDAETHRHFCDFANIAVTLGLPAGSRILDVGCGSGWLSEYFARLGYQMKGIDISPVLIEMSRERLARVPYDVDHETGLRCSFEVHDIEVGPLSEQFDAVICYDSLHHFEDEGAVLHHIAAMLPVGGVLFILEGERPPLGSATEEELYGVMNEYGTLESPFDYGHLRQILDEHGFAVIGDYASVNGLFERETIADDLLPLKNVAINYHYLACKKVVEGAPASSVFDSRHPGLLRAHIVALDRGPERLVPGQALDIELEIENAGNTLWLAGQEARIGIVMPGILIIDDAGTLVSEFHGEPPLPRAMAPGETVRLKIEHAAPERPGRYTLKFDLVNQHVCWFEDVGSAPLTIGFEVIEK